MATSSSELITSKRRLTTTPASASKRSQLASPSAALTASVAAIQALLGAMALESLPPLPIISKNFGFLKCVNLSSVGLGLNEIPFEFGWDLVV